MTAVQKVPLSNPLKLLKRWRIISDRLKVGGRPYLTEGWLRRTMEDDHGLDAEARGKLWYGNVDAMRGAAKQVLDAWAATDVSVYAERHRSGQRVGTSLAEGMAENLVNRRMNKSQHMRWSRDGALYLLNIRAAILNDNFKALALAA